MSTTSTDIFPNAATSGGASAVSGSSTKKPRKSSAEKLADLEAKQTKLANQIKNEKAKISKQKRKECSMPSSIQKASGNEPAVP